MTSLCECGHSKDEHDMTHLNCRHSYSSVAACQCEKFKLSTEPVSTSYYEDYITINQNNQEVKMTKLQVISVAEELLKRLKG